MAKRYFPRYKYFIVASAAIIFVVLISGISGNFAQAKTFHTEAERRVIDHIMTLPVDTSLWFAASGKCGGCHGHDPAGIAMVTASGEDINIADDWAGTMMANSAKDPFWRAKVSHEILINPLEQSNIENTCTRCHAPLGRFEAEYTNQLPYSIDSMINDSIAMDGVSCSACHQQQDTLFGNNFSGNLHYMRKHVYGPFSNIFVGPMQFFDGFTPSYGAHIDTAALCGACHSLITDTHDLAGNPTGGHYIEQATYHEWKNSIYSASNTKCQNCHIPSINEPIRLATNYPFLTPKQPFGKHHLVGGNAFMLKLMKNNMTAISATCQPSNYDTTIARTTRNLRDSTMDMHVIQTARTVDTVFYDVQLQNKAGHKFPSGYPSRIAWVQFVVTDMLGDTLFQSGMLDGNGNIVGRDVPFEPHHNVCYTNNDVQIYEMVMGDVNNNVTTVLERADTCLKDNRLVPKGFSTSHPSYDSTLIIGVGNDPDFNYSGPTEGTGGDVVHYHVFLNGYGGSLNISSSVYYQSVPRAWLQDMFSYSSPEISSFQSMYNSADQTPMLVAQVTMNNTVTSSDQNPIHPEISVFPVPSADGHISISGWQKSNLVDVRVYDLAGKEVMDEIPAAQFTGTIDLPKRGVYLLVMDTKEGKIVKRVMW